MIKLYAFNLNEIKINFPISENIEKDNKICTKRLLRKKQRLVGNKLIELLVLEYKGINICGSDIIKGAFGKPYLKNIQDFHFNISHDGDWIICGICNKNIGVNISCITYSESIARNFFSTDEYNACKKYKTLFRQFWALKEAYCKWSGEGIIQNFNCFDFSTKLNKIKRDRLVKQGPVYFRCIKFKDSYSIAICSEHRNIPNTIVELNSKDLKIDFT